jgi:hypothetical protein
VARLGEFSPIESLFTLGSFVKNYRRSTNIWATYLNGKSYVLIISKNELGDILGDFFTNASGHPGLHKCLWWLFCGSIRIIQ